MKIRTNFVSNSSTTSFICVGINLNLYPQLKKMFGVSGFQRKPKSAEKLPPNTECMDFTHLDFGCILGLNISDGNSIEIKEEDMGRIIQYTKELENATGVKPKLFFASEIERH